MTAGRRLFLPLVLALLLAACAAAGPRFAQLAAGLPPMPPGAARVFFYRWLEPYETLSWTPVYLDGWTVGVSEPGSVFYRDVAPGTYLIAVRSEGVYPNQFKTVALAPGTVVAVRIASLRSWSTRNIFRDLDGDTFVVGIVDPATAAREMAGLRLIGG